MAEIKEDTYWQNWQFQDRCQVIKCLISCNDQEDQILLKNPIKRLDLLIYAHAYFHVARRISCTSSIPTVFCSRSVSSARKFLTKAHQLSIRITVYLATFLIPCKKGDSVETTVSPQRENNEMDLCKVHLKKQLIFIYWIWLLPNWITSSEIIWQKQIGFPSKPCLAVFLQARTRPIKW